MGTEEKEAPRCAFLHVHPERVAAVREKMPPDGAVSGTADLFRVLGDGTRMRILFSLFSGELCVCDIAALLGMTVSAISHQLRVLRDAALVACRREGKTVFYSLADAHVRTILEQGMEHILE